MGLTCFGAAKKGLPNAINCAIVTLKNMRSHKCIGALEWHTRKGQPANNVTRLNALPERSLLDIVLCYVFNYPRFRGVNSCPAFVSGFRPRWSTPMSGNWETPDDRYGRRNRSIRMEPSLTLSLRASASRGSSAAPLAACMIRETLEYSSFLQL